jgi:CheY-like chemotaxis protein
MNLDLQLKALKSSTRSVFTTEHVELSCSLAKEFEKAGEYEKAREALSDFWPEENSPPQVELLETADRGKILLRVGALISWLGNADQAEGSQEKAKNLITQAVGIFERLGERRLLAEAQGDLALCYWREGAYDEARVTLATAVTYLSETDTELKALLLIRAGIVEVWSDRFNEALHFYNEAAPLLEESVDHALKGAFHNEFGLVFRRLAVPENREEYLDRALIEYSAASFHFEQAGNIRYLARVETNLGFLFFTIGRYKQAHSHLDRARRFFLELKDVGMVAQVDETRARTFLAEGRLADAERLVKSVVKTLEKGDEQAVLAEAVTTYGTVKARLGRYARARELFDRAIEIAETAGDLEGAGRAKLSIIEELSAQTSPVELASTFESGAELLQKSQDPSSAKRLTECAQVVINALTGHEGEAEIPLEVSWEDFSLRQQVRNFEKALIEKALRESGGAVTKAAHLLGFKHHQSLISLINSRHRDLLETRSAVRRRRRHMFSRPRRLKRKLRTPAPERSSSKITILHVEDHKLIADLVNELFDEEEWSVERCEDGDTALRKLTGNDHYDVLVVDNTLPGLSGIELVQRARKMTHRRRMPMVMLSGDDNESEAWRAGVDAFLKKPEQIGNLPATINRLLREGVDVN